MKVADDRVIFDRLRLIRSKNVGPVGYARLIKRYGNARRALEALPELAQKRGGKTIEIAKKADIEHELEEASKCGAKFLFRGDREYPLTLSAVDNAPAVLCYRGDVSLLTKSSVAMVGARNASAAARKFAHRLAHDLSSNETPVVSGLARGIDTAAHQGALDHGTIAVIAGGIDVHFPPENRELQEQVADKGLLLAEQPIGTEPRARHFPYRNRIISGLAAGTVVVEAAPKSGSLITARLASEQGRYVMAVPGSPMDPRSRGCNSLIREGATLVQTAEDILELIAHFDDRMKPHTEDMFENLATPSLDREIHSITSAASDDQKTAIVGLLSMTATGVDEIIRQSGMDSALVQTILLELELSGKLARHAGGKVSLTT